MRAYVITLTGLAESVRVAERCVASGKEHGQDVFVWAGYTPRNQLQTMLDKRGIPVALFKSHSYSRVDPCVAAFLSHHALWTIASKSSDPILILEHDAVFTAPVPKLDLEEGDVCNIGKPSYGKFNTPAKGVGPLVSKRYFPGAHAYVVTPAGARQLLRVAKTKAAPTDVFLSLDNFPGLTEYYPWPIVVDDHFTTIQKREGCVAKHNKVRVI